MICEGCSFFIDEICTDLEGYIHKETGLSVCRYNPSAILREKAECEFCKRERPLILYGEYQICYNCMMRVIATAPELLDACEAAEYSLVCLTRRLGADEKKNENLRDVRAAIAKAKGEGNG